MWTPWRIYAERRVRSTVAKCYQARQNLFSMRPWHASPPKREEWGQMCVGEKHTVLGFNLLLIHVHTSSYPACCSSCAAGNTPLPPSALDFTGGCGTNRVLTSSLSVNFAKRGIAWLSVDSNSSPTNPVEIHQALVWLQIGALTPAEERDTRACASVFISV